jgi:hypothetical protein
VRKHSKNKTNADSSFELLYYFFECLVSVWGSSGIESNQNHLYFLSQKNNITVLPKFSHNDACLMIETRKKMN